MVKGTIVEFELHGYIILAVLALPKVLYCTGPIEPLRAHYMLQWSSI